MRRPSDSRLRNDRRHLARVLKDLTAGTFAGLSKAEMAALREVVVLRLAEIDTLLGEGPDPA